MTTFTFNGVTYDSDDLIGAGSDPSKRYSTAVTAGTGDSLPLFIAMILDGLVDVSNGATTTSTSSVAVGTGSKTFVLSEEIPYYAGDYVLVTRTSDPVDTSLYGTVASRSGTTLNLTITDVNGSGTYTDWTIRLAGAKGATGTTGSVGGLADGAAATPSLTFTSDTDVGLYLAATGELGVTAAGTKSAGFTSTGLSIPSQITHDGDTDTYLAFADDQIDFNVGGKAMLSLIEGANDFFEFNPNNEDMDFIYNAASLADAIKMDAFQQRLELNMGLHLKRTVVSGATHTTLKGEYLYGVTRTSTGACTITLNTSLGANRSFIIKDEGLSAATNNITLTPSSGTIEGEASFVIDVNGGRVAVYCDGTNWFVV